MTTDRELLQRVHREAARRIRRRRVVASAAVVVAIVGLSAAAAAVADRDGSDRLETIAPADTSTTVETTAPPTTPSSTTEATTSTSSPTIPPPTTVPPPTSTTVPPLVPVTATKQVGGLKVVATATQDRSRPGQVALTIQVADGHGSHPTGYVLWDQAAYTTWGDAFTEDGTGDFGAWLFSECDEVMDGDPETNLGPDPEAATTERTIDLGHDYGDITGEVRIRLEVSTSLCSTDQESTPVELIVPIER